MQISIMLPLVFPANHFKLLHKERTICNENLSNRQGGVCLCPFFSCSFLLLSLLRAPIPSHKLGETLSHLGSSPVEFPVKSGALFFAQIGPALIPKTLAIYLVYIKSQESSVLIPKGTVDLKSQERSVLIPKGTVDLGRLLPLSGSPICKMKDLTILVSK